MYCSIYLRIDGFIGVPKIFERLKKNFVIRVVLLTIVMMSCVVIGLSYASDQLCLPTEKMSANLGADKYAFTATLIAGTTEKGFVMQLFTKKDGFVMTWARNYGRTSCVVLKGDEWIWAHHPII